ncbi:Calx-beta domain-containing protein [Gorillibacterium sp. sgz5001074]|uniref:Calx-beta domain-containing protein n=1 Tax=Gorillibacterium sp. sgz5001074 TaxID=3446695 RepID=UPI003F661674
MLSAALLSAALLLPPVQGVVKASGTSGVIDFASTYASVVESEGVVYLDLVRTGSTSGEITVPYTALDGSASAWSDFGAVSDTVTFADGEDRKTIAIPIYDDTDMEGSEDFTVALGTPTGGAVLGPGSAAGVTIEDDDYWIPDPAGVLQLEKSAYTVHEGESFLSFNVYRTDGAGGQVSVDIGVSSGSAMEGQDYSVFYQTLTFNEGETWKSFGIDILDDQEVEGDESFGVTLHNPTGGAVVGPLGSAGVTILDNDVELPPQYGTLQLESTDAYVNEQDGTVQLTVVRSDGYDGTVSVDYAAGSGTAVEGEDFEKAAGTLVFPDGETFGTLTLPLVNDTVREDPEEFRLTLSNPMGGAVLGPNFTARIHVSDDDDEWLPDPAGVLQLEAAQATVHEGESYAVFQVTRTDGAGGEVTVDYSIGGGTAQEGQDYETAGGTLVFQEGETVKSIGVPLLDDYDYEGAETFTVMLSNPGGGAVLGALTATEVTIADNEAAPLPTGTVQFERKALKVKEMKDSVTLKVSRTGGTSGPLSVDYETVDGTAQAGTDYTAVQGTLVFGDGEMVKTIFIPLLDDRKREGNEEFSVRLFATASQERGKGAGTVMTVTIMDNDR